MITITIYKDQNDRYRGFDSIGHAGYAEAGEDIICAGVSALVLNTVNSVEAFTQDPFDMNTLEENGFISFRFRKAPSTESQLLLKSLVLGLQGIQNSYGNEYILLIFKEV